MRFYRLSTALLLTLLSFGVGAAPAFSDCAQMFADRQAPSLDVPDGRALCFIGFAVYHSGSSRTPLYVAERLNRTRLLDAKGEQRTDKFYAEARLPRAERAELADYRGSGYDRGHLAPAADMADPESMAQSFSLANMVPQAPANNQIAWNSIEAATRHYVMRAKGDVFVISGPVFTANDAVINGRVRVPAYLFKLVYDPVAGKAWAHWLANTDTARVGKPISYAELVQRTGIEFLPSLHAGRN